MKTFYVYEDWTLEPCPRCFYVGKGDYNRVKKLTRNNDHQMIVDTYGQQRKIVLETSDEIEALNHEKKLIHDRHTHKNDVNYNGIGVNKTYGGQGNSGRIVTKETCDKISKAKKGKKSNKIWSKEEREATSKRMSSLHKGKKISEEHKEKLRKRMQNSNIKQEMILKVTNKIRQKLKDPKFRKHIIETRARGENSYSSIKESDVKQMRLEWKNIDLSIKGNKHIGQSPSRKFCQDWANRLGVTSQAIYAIVTMKTWKHI